MATAKKAAPAKKSSKTATPADDDMLSTKGKKAAKAAPAKGKGKAAAAEDDLLSTKPKKAGKAAAAPAKKSAKAPKADDGTEGTRDEVRAVLLKTKKATSYADIAAANNFNVRMVRRTARALAANSEVEITHEGTTGYVRKL